jgi:hypothetical protein
MMAENALDATYGLLEEANDGIGALVCVFLPFEQFGNITNLRLHSGGHDYASSAAPGDGGGRVSHIGAISKGNLLVMARERFNVLAGRKRLSSEESFLDFQV